MLDVLKLKLYGKYVRKLMKDHKIPGFAVGLSQHGVTDKLKWTQLGCGCFPRPLIDESL